jgi:hypothetical protein
MEQLIFYFPKHDSRCNILIHVSELDCGDDGASTVDHHLLFVLELLPSAAQPSSQPRGMASFIFWKHELIATSFGSMIQNWIAEMMSHSGSSSPTTSPELEVFVADKSPKGAASFLQPRREVLFYFPNMD